MKPPKFGNCSIEEFATCDNPPISIDDLHCIFRKENPDESAVKKLKNQLDSLVERDDWEEEDLVALDYSGGELVDIVLYSTSGYLCRRLRKATKCETCRQALLTKLETSELAVAELVNSKTKGFLLYCNVYLYDIFRKTETYFVKNAVLSDCYERTLTDVFENVSLNFPCEEHKSEMLATSLHYFILMRMRQYEREQNRSLKMLSQNKKKASKLCVS